MGKPDLAKPLCGLSRQQPDAEQAERRLELLQTLSKSMLVLAGLLVLIGGSGIVGQFADFIPSESGVAELHLPDFVWQIALVVSGLALGVAAYLCSRAIDLHVRAQLASRESKIREDVVRKNEERYRMLLRATSTIYGDGSVDGGINKFLDGWQRYTGQSWEEQRGDGWINVIHPDDRDRILNLWNETLRTKCTTRVEYRLWHADSGSYRFCESAAAPIFNSDGSLREWVAVVQDIDDRSKLSSGTYLTHYQE